MTHPTREQLLAARKAMTPIVMLIRFARSGENLWKHGEVSIGWCALLMANANAAEKALEEITKLLGSE